MMYNFLVAGNANPRTLSAFLARAFAVSPDHVDVSPEDELEARNWDATVTCEYQVLTGDLTHALTVYGAAEVQSQPADDDLAESLARALDAPVLTPWGTLPWIRKVYTPRGTATFARVEQLEGDVAGFTVYGLESPMTEFPHARVEPFPEVARDYPLPTPETDRAFSSESGVTHSGTQALLREWEKLCSRMAAHWPPTHWYSAEMYQEDLENRSRLSDAIEFLTGEERERVGDALTALDARFRALTVDDGGQALMSALRSKKEDTRSLPWYWQRRPIKLPWEQTTN
ncbi:hypothetical protein ACPCSC_09055 [Streptomyces lavendulocolor]|uniref:hypothetical protein n=1 Tax=Streptomyces lavendulocolor TaxID=67316 RepID=UPI003C2F9F54